MRKIFGDFEGFIKFMGVEMDKKEVGKRIRQARIRLGLSRANLAKLVGVNERTITNYENGKTMKPSILQKIAKALEVALSIGIKSSIRPKLPHIRAGIALSASSFFFSTL